MAVAGTALLAVAWGASARAGEPFVPPPASGPVGHYPPLPYGQSFPGYYYPRYYYPRSYYNYSFGLDYYQPYYYTPAPAVYYAPPVPFPVAGATGPGGYSTTYRIAPPPYGPPPYGPPPGVEALPPARMPPADPDEGGPPR